MKLWLIKAKLDLPKGDNPWDPWYDKVHGFVIRAESEKAARLIAHHGPGWEQDTIPNVNPWLDPKYSTCEEIFLDGETEDVIMMDYREG